MGPQRLRARSQRSTYRPAAPPRMPLSHSSPWQCPHRSHSLLPFCAWPPGHFPPGWHILLHFRAQQKFLLFQRDPLSLPRPLCPLLSLGSQHLELVGVKYTESLSLLRFGPLLFVKSGLCTRWLPRSLLPAVRCSEL